MVSLYYYEFFRYVLSREYYYILQQSYTTYKSHQLVKVYTIDGLVWIDGNTKSFLTNYENDLVGSTPIKDQYDSNRWHKTRKQTVRS